MNLPTDNAPLKVIPDFQLRGSSFLYQERDIPYTNVVGIKMDSFKQSINFVPVSHGATLFICCPDTITVAANSPLLKLPSHRRLESAFQIISKKTFAQRIIRYLEDFRKRGFIRIGRATIHKNGDIVQGPLRLNIQECMQGGGQFSIGTYQGGSHASRSNPHEVLLTSGKNSLFKRSPTILFEIPWDRDVVGVILRHIRQGTCHDLFIMAEQGAGGNE